MKISEDQSGPIHTVHIHDVLCGRGRGISKHIGNIRYRELIFERRVEYSKLPNEHKIYLSQSIVYAVRTLNPPGRFLQRDPATNSWFDVGDQRAKEKTSQVLREAAASLRKEMNLNAIQNTHIESNQESRGEYPSDPTRSTTLSQANSSLRSLLYSQVPETINVEAENPLNISSSAETSDKAHLISSHYNKGCSSSWHMEKITEKNLSLLPDKGGEGLSFNDAPLPSSSHALVKDFSCRSLDIDEGFMDRSEHKSLKNWYHRRRKGGEGLSLNDALLSSSSHSLARDLSCRSLAIDEVFMDRSEHKYLKNSYHYRRNSFALVEEFEDSIDGMEFGSVHSMEHDTAMDLDERL